jgi:hypothetical protein
MKALRHQLNSNSMHLNQGIINVDIIGPKG